MRIDSWLQVLPGQRVHANGYHQIAKAMPEAKLREMLDGMRAEVETTLACLPDCETFIRRYGGAPDVLANVQAKLKALLQI